MRARDMIRKQLDKRAVKFMRTNLGGGGAFAAQLLEAWPWQAARYYAYAYPGVSDERLYAFETGGLIDVENSEPESTGGEEEIATPRELLALDAQRMMAAVDGCRVAEHVLARCADPFLQSDEFSAKFFCVKNV